MGDVAAAPAAGGAAPAAAPGDGNGGSNLRALLLALLLVAMLPVVLPLTVVLALLAAVPAAVWWLARQPPGADAAGAAKKDEDLGLDPPNHSVLGRSTTGAARKQPAQQAQQPQGQQQQQPLGGGKAAESAAAAALPRVAQQHSDEPIVMLAVNGTRDAGAGSPKKAPGAATAAAAGVAAAGAAAAVGAAAAAAGAAAAKPPPAPPAAAAAAAANGPTPPPQQQPSQAAPAPDAGAAPVALTGSAAILAKLRSQRASGAGAAGSRPDSGSRAGPAPPKATVLYASQTGTGQEIARTIHAECAAKGLPAQVMSMNELGWEGLRPDKTPVVVVVASSTGDGDPPDNAAAAFVALKKAWPADRLTGLRFTVLGLGDSNYTRFMHVPRAIKNRFAELGGVCFYPCAEADEVDGLEDTVDPWCEGLVAALQQALHAVQAGQPTPAAPAAAAAAKAAAAPGPASAQPAGGVASEPSNSHAAAEASVAAPSAGAAAMGAGQARPSSGQLSGQASLLGEDSSQLGVALPVPPSIAAAGAAPPTQLVDGLAPKGVDLKGVPPLAPCRIQLSTSLPASEAAAARAREAALPSREQRFYRDPTGNYSASAPFWATLSDARLLTAESSDRTVIHVELDVADSGMRFGPGDAVGVLPHNDAALVAGLLARLGLDGDDVFTVAPAQDDEEDGSQQLLSHIAWPCTLRHAFTTGVDLTSVPRKSLLRLLAEHCSDEDEGRTLLFLASRAGREAYAAEVTAGQPSLLDLLRRFPSCAPPVAALLDALPPLAPRMYSLANAPVPAPGPGQRGGVPGAAGAAKVQFALSVVEFATQYGTRRGVATTWLAKLCRPWLTGDVAPGTPPSALPEVWVPVFLRRAVDFRPPASLATPLLMIGPGTGVAPFRGFLQQRLAAMQAAEPAAAAAAAPALLYFGCRRPGEDYLYEADWAALRDAGALSSLRVAFSRAQAAKVYVQHLLREDAAEVARLVAAGGHVYVCGDGGAMARDVHAALCAVLRDQLGLSEAQAGDELAAMAKAGRYVRDIWS